MEINNLWLVSSIIAFIIGTWSETNRKSSRGISPQFIFSCVCYIILGISIYMYVKSIKKKKKEN